MSLPLRFDEPIVIGLFIVLIGIVAGFVGVRRRRARAEVPESRLLGKKSSGVVQRLGWMRLTTLLLLALAASGLEVAGGAHGPTTVFVLDGSASITDRDRQMALEYVHRAAEDSSRSERFGLVVFGEEALVEAPLTGSGLPAEIRSQPGPDGTDLAAGLRLASGMIARESAGRLVLLSDGNQTSGDALTEARMAVARALTIDVVPLGVDSSASVAEVMIASVEGPNRVALDEPFGIWVEVASTRETEAAVRLSVDGLLVSQQNPHLETSIPGRLEFIHSFQDAGFHTVTAVVEAGEDRHHENNEAGVVIHASGRPAVLYVAEQGRGEDLRSSLDRQGFRVETLLPDEAVIEGGSLDRYDAIVLHDVSAERLGGTGMTALDDYVTGSGGGLMMMGAARALGPGGYAGTPVEEVLPVTMRVRSRQESPGLAVVLVLDKSGSMAGRESGISKLEAAVDAAVVLAQTLDPSDLFGVIAFDEAAAEVVSLRRLADSGSLRQLLAGVQAGGGTRMVPALMRAYAWLEAADSQRKQVILLSDGQADTEEVDEIRNLVAGSAVVLSAVGIGGDVDAELLTELSEAGGGRSYLAETLDELEQIFHEEARAISADWLVERRFQPSIVQEHPVLSGFEVAAFPEMTGYVASTAKPGAQVLLESDIGEPILVGWRRGLGKALALTSDPSSVWMGPWNRWRDFDRFWVQSIRWLSRRLQSEMLLPEISVDGDRATITIDAYVRDSRVLSSMKIEGILRSPQGQERQLSFDQTALGRYEASVEISDSGAYTAMIAAVNSGGFELASLHQGFFVSSGIEYRRLAPDEVLLLELARTTGGSILDFRRPFDNETVATHYRPAWPLLVILALVLFVLEIILRRRAGLLPRQGSPQRS